MNFIFLRFMEVWTKRVPCTFRRHLLYTWPVAFIRPWTSENEIYFLNTCACSRWSDVLAPATLGRSPSPLCSMFDRRQNCSMFPLAFVAGWLQGHWWDFISRNYVVWPTFLLMNVFTALKGSHFWFLFDFTAAGVVPCGGRKTSPRTSTMVQFIFYFGPLRSAIIFWEIRNKWLV